MRLTLNGIKRRGTANCKAFWAMRQQAVMIWSAEHRAWWRSRRAGYTTDKAQAGIYEFPAAYEATKHCGPEKRIEYVSVP